MAISGLVITVRNGVDAGAFACALEALETHIEAGKACGARFPVVATTESGREDERLLERLASLPEVVSVEVAFVEVADAARALPSERDGIPALVPERGNSSPATEGGGHDAR